MSDYGHAITTRQMIAAAVLLGDVSGPSFVGGRGAPGIEAGWVGLLAVVLLHREVDVSEGSGRNRGDQDLLAKGRNGGCWSLVLVDGDVMVFDFLEPDMTSSSFSLLPTSLHARLLHVRAALGRPYA